MSPSEQPDHTPGSPPLSDLLFRYLAQRMSDRTAGLAVPEPAGEVVPYDATPVQPIEPRAAWEDALAVLPYYGAGAAPASLAVPPEWGALVAAHEPALALAFCLGNFPQLVRSFQQLLHADREGSLRPQAGPPLPAPALVDWAGRVGREGHFPQALLALGCLRLARQFDLLRELAAAVDQSVPSAWRGAWENEQAAARWHEGRADEAYALWQAQGEAVPVLFNRGMAALFLRRRTEARSCLARAAAELPEDRAWHHLAQLYLLLADGGSH